MPALNMNCSVASKFLRPLDGFCLRVEDRAGALSIRFCHCPPLVVNLYEDFIMMMATHFELLPNFRFEFPRRHEISGAARLQITPLGELCQDTRQNKNVFI